MEFGDHQFICMVPDQGIKWFVITWTFTFWQWKPVVHNLDNTFPYLNSSCSNRFILNPSGLAKMQKKNITTKFLDINLSLQVIYWIFSLLHVKLYWFPNLFPSVLFAGQLVTHEGDNCQCWSTWRTNSVHCNWNEVWVHPSYSIFVTSSKQSKGG